MLKCKISCLRWICPKYLITTFSPSANLSISAPKNPYLSGPGWNVFKLWFFSWCLVNFFTLIQVLKYCETIPQNEVVTTCNEIPAQDIFLHMAAMIPLEKRWCRLVYKLCIFLQFILETRQSGASYQTIQCVWISALKHSWEKFVFHLFFLRTNCLRKGCF